jgi:hypothetical protein
VKSRVMDVTIEFKIPVANADSKDEAVYTAKEQLSELISQDYIDDYAKVTVKPRHGGK